MGVQLRKADGRVAVCAALALAAAATNAQQGVWSAPENLGSVINSAAGEQHAALSPDGLSLYFSSDRAGGAGGFDLWVSRRNSPASAWQAPQAVTVLNSAAAEFAPAFDPSGLWLFFGSERDGGCGGRDLWLSHRFDAARDDRWSAPVNMGCGVLSWTGFDDGPTYFQDGKRGVLFFISDRPGGLGLRDLWTATHANGGAFSAPVNVAELNSGADDSRPSVRADGLELFVTSQRAGSVPQGVTPSSDIWVSRRTATGAAWPALVNVAELNSSATEAAPTLSRDGRIMIFTSNRPGGQGGLDLWTTSRSSTN
jgi:Tol biopolymer transport system component